MKRNTKPKKKVEQGTKPPAKKKEAKAPALASRHYNILNPQDVDKVVRLLKQFVEETRAYHKSADGKKYPLFHAYQYVGTMFGMRGKIVNTGRELLPGNIENYLYKAEAILLDNVGSELENAIGFCQVSEDPKYSTHSTCSSMSQTRAKSKAFRLHLGWIMRKAGLEDTPGEEMQGTSNKSVSDMTAADMAQLFVGITGLKSYNSVLDQNKKLKTNAMFKEASRVAYTKAQEYERDNG